MDKNEFIIILRTRLQGLPKEDIERSVEFYSEMIDDRMEDGLSEEEAVAAIGEMENIISQTIAETSLPKLVKEKIKIKRPLRTWEIVLLVLGSPVWLSLLIAFAAVVFSVAVSIYAVIWSVVISFYAVALALALTPLAAIVNLIISLVNGQVAISFIYLGGGVTCAGLAVLMFYGCNACAKGALWLGKKIYLGLKRCIVGKGAKK